MTIFEFTNNILESPNKTNIILFDVENDNIIYQGRADNVPYALSERIVKQIKYDKILLLEI